MNIAFSCASAYYGTTTWKLNNIGTYQPGNALLAMEAGMIPINTSDNALITA